MKLQVLSSSFGKVLAAAAITFMISSAAPAHAQQQQWGRDNCLYVAQSGRWVRQGCVLPGTQIYLNDATKVFTDLNTKMSFFKGQDGRMLVLTSTGWMDAQAYVAQVQANRSNPSGSGVVGGGYTGSGTITIGGKSNAFTDPQGRPYPDSMFTSGVVGMVLGSADRNVRNWTNTYCNPAYSVCPQ